MKLVIGLAGLPLAGKETVANKLGALFRADGVTVRYSPRKTKPKV